MFVWVAAVALSLTGLSQIYRSQFWMQYYDALLMHGATAVRGHGTVVGVIGGLVVILHNVWAGPTVVLTAFGWLLVAEGAFTLIAPQISLRAMSMSEPSARHGAIIVTGAAILIVAGVLWAVLLGPLLF